MQKNLSKHKHREEEQREEVSSLVDGQSHWNAEMSKRL
jgi:hypothetical protein